MIKKLKYYLIRFLLFFVTPVILLFSTKIQISGKERFQFFSDSFLKLAPVAFIINAFFNWHNEHEVFLKSLYAVLVLNLSLGVATHWKLKTFDIGELMKSTLITVAVIFCVYFSLSELNTAIPEGLLHVGFSSGVQIMTLLFPISKILRNCFVLSNGKFPPEFLIEKLYNYERDGNIKEFINIMNKNESENQNIE